MILYLYLFFLYFTNSLIFYMFYRINNNEYIIFRRKTRELLYRIDDLFEITDDPLSIENLEIKTIDENLINLIKKSIN